MTVHTRADGRPAAAVQATRTLQVQSHETRALAIIFFLTLFGVVLIRTAWLGDDAFITFRSVDNLVSGLGPRWNADERVQAFTHPLWLVVLTVPYFFTREAYFTPLVTTMLLSLGAMWLLLSRITASTMNVVIAGTVLLLSKAFVDYSTSGLENPLTHFLLALFLVCYFRSVAAPDGSLVPLWSVGGLLMVNRLDLALLILPPLAVSALGRIRRQVVRGAAMAILPVAAWELFSIVYYGFPFPNTAYAKLQTGIPAGELMTQGLLYLVDAVAQDPVTPLAIVTATTAGVRLRRSETWPFALGTALYLAFIVRIGGDFMTGRFLSAPVFFAVAVFARVRWRFPPRAVPVALAAFVMLGVFATTRPPVTSGASTYILNVNDGVGAAGIADERAFYYRYTGLLRWSRELPLPHNDDVLRGKALRAEPRVVRETNIGFVGYFAGPAVHIIDEYALADPLLARLPSEGRWRVGHYRRTAPQGYEETIATGRNVFADPAIGMLYERIRTITAGPLGAPRRWAGCVSMNFGAIS